MAMRYGSTIGGILLVGLTVLGGATAAHAGVALVRRIETWTADGPRIGNPSGITRLASGALLVVDAEVDGSSPPPASNFWELDPAVRRARRALDLRAFTRQPTGLAYDPARESLYVIDDDALRLYELDASGRPVAHVDLAALGARDPEGLAFDTRRGHLYVADGRGRQVLELTNTGSLVSFFSLDDTGIEEAEGIVHDPASDHLYVVSDRDGLLVEVTRRGELVGAYSLVELGAIRPHGVALARTGDPSGPRRLFVADAMTRRHPDGRILEVALMRRPHDARQLTSLVGDVDGFGFRGAETDFPRGDLDHDGLLEDGERIPLTGHASGEDLDNREPGDDRATDVMLGVREDAPLRFDHQIDLGGRPAVWARLTLLVGDARALPGARTQVLADGRLVGELIPTRAKRLHAGAIAVTVLELPPDVLHDLADGALRVELMREDGSGSDELMLDYSRLEVAVAH
jgi:hypothetical protein